jgi:predicted amidohydrolase
VESFRDAVSAPVRTAVREFAPDLIVFPEYTTALLALAPYRRALADSVSVQDCLERIQSARPGLTGLRALFLEQSAAVDKAMQEIFGALAREGGCTIVAGSFFAREAGAAGPELRNRACVFAPDGELFYTQDKVFLTDFERDRLGVSPGSVQGASIFRVERDHGRRVGGALAALTVCRDTFHPDWEKGFAGADLWIDVKANGTSFTPQEEQGFREALSARLAASGIGSGITACLVGRILDLVWQGKSSVLRLGPGGPQSVAEAAAADDAEILYAEIPY